MEIGSVTTATWPTIRSALESWVEGITGLDCYWEKRPRPAVFGDDGYGILKLRGRRTVGNDDVITTYDDTIGKFRVYQAGQRQFTFQIQIRTYLQSDDDDALYYTTLLRNQVCLQESDDAFAAVKTSFARVLSETDIDYILDDREMSICQLDLLMNAAVITEGTSVDYVKYLEDMEFQDNDNPSPPLYKATWTVG